MLAQRKALRRKFPVMLVGCVQLLSADGSEQLKVPMHQQPMERMIHYMAWNPSPPLWKMRPSA